MSTITIILSPSTSSLRFPLSSAGTRYSGNSSLSTTSTQPDSNSILLATQPQDKPTNHFFPILSLPLEIRLKIYTYLLPPRHHKIAFQAALLRSIHSTTPLPIPNLSASSALERASSSATTTGPHHLTLVPKILTRNFRSDYPYQNLEVQLLRTCKQIHREAEPLLYSSPGAVFDFGVLGLNVFSAFWDQRSERARESVREIRIAVELGSTVGGEPSKMWRDVGDYMKREFLGLTRLDLKFWCVDGGVKGIPVGLDEAVIAGKVISNISDVAITAKDGVDLENPWAVEEARTEAIRKFRSWGWTKRLLETESLRATRITWWGFEGSVGGNGLAVGSNRGFDGWLAGRMVVDEEVRERMVREGLVVEAVVEI